MRLFLGFLLLLSLALPGLALAQSTPNLARKSPALIKQLEDKGNLWVLENPGPKKDAMLLEVLELTGEIWANLWIEVQEYQKAYIAAKNQPVVNSEIVSWFESEILEMLGLLNRYSERTISSQKKIAGNLINNGFNSDHAKRLKFLRGENQEIAEQNKNTNNSAQSYARINRGFALYTLGSILTSGGVGVAHGDPKLISGLVLSSVASLVVSLVSHYKHNALLGEIAERKLMIIPEDLVRKEYNHSRILEERQAFWRGVAKYTSNDLNLPSPEGYVQWLEEFYSYYDMRAKDLKAMVAKKRSNVDSSCKDLLLFAAPPKKGLLN